MTCGSFDYIRDKRPLTTTQFFYSCVTVIERSIKKKKKNLCMISFIMIMKKKNT